MGDHGFSIAKRVLLLCRALYGLDEEKDSLCSKGHLII